MLIQAKPLLRMKLPFAEWRHPLFFLAMTKWFDRFIYLSIIINTVFLAILWYGQPETSTSIMERVNYIFTGIFVFELIIKLLAFGKRYFKDPWNVFDLVIVVFTIVGIILGYSFNTSLGP